MEAKFVIEIMLLIVIIAQMVLFIIFIIKRSGDKPEKDISQKFIDYEKKLDKNESSMRDEFGRIREETNKSAREAREELASSLKSFEEKFSCNITNFTSLTEIKIKSISELMEASSKNGREELTKALNSFEEKFSFRIGALTKDTTAVLEKMRETIEKKLADIQKENGEKLEKMRETVDEKLHKTLETRLGESFKLVSERLEMVQKGLGEMQSLASGVGDLKKVLSNVKTKGVLGEYQLSAILEQLLSPNQYAKNVATKQGSRDNVEFAVKIPGREEGKTVWLPVDSKFPTVSYESLMDAYDAADGEGIEKSKKELESRIKNFAKEIHVKYIDPPNTTEFAIMFLPFEGLYAEVLRIPSLFEYIQNTYKVTITGPTTISAFLNSLQMGFRTLAVEKRTNEIWNVLGAVRVEFGKFAVTLEAAKKKLEQAGAELEKTGTRTRQIEKKLSGFDVMPEMEAQKLLPLD
ncbi:MAG: DNA recombination protein RmuC [Spirochaetaceae bacterium]|jgi:DNA recombination protein RmuC|nr:DNA recombination protein RmuC [Spirochaetaceae bacterium]